MDLLLEHHRAARSTSAVEARLRQAGSVNGVLSNVSHELSNVSHHLGFVLAPTNEVAGFEHIEFVPLDGTRILVLVTAHGQQVCHKVIDIGERVQRCELEQGANYLNQEFSGLTLGEVRASVVERLRREQVLYDELLSRSLRLMSSTLEDMVPHESVFVDGATFLFDEVSDDDGPVPLATMRALLSMMQEKHRLVRLLSEYLGTDGLTVVIGAAGRQVVREGVQFADHVELPDDVLVDLALLGLVDKRPVVLAVAETLDVGADDLGPVGDVV